MGKEAYVWIDEGTLSAEEFWEGDGEVGDIIFPKKKAPEDKETPKEVIDPDIEIGVMHFSNLKDKAE